MCVRDVWQAGTALLQVSQARQPSWKLNHRFGVSGMAGVVQAAPDGLVLPCAAPRRCSAWHASGVAGAATPCLVTLAPAPRALSRTNDGPAPGEIAALPELAEGWRLRLKG